MKFRSYFAQFIFIFCIVCLTHSSANAGQIRVEATGHASAAPDRIFVTLGISALHADYAAAMSVSSVQLEAVRAAIAPVGFTSDDLRTTELSVNAEYTHSRGDNGEYTRTFAGYRVFNNITLNFAMDTGRLASVLSAIASSEVNPSISIALSVTDELPLRDIALMEAASIARRRAEVLAAASSAQIGPLISIEAVNSIGYVSRPMMKMEAAAMNDSQAPMIAPSNIEISETAIFTWETR